MKEILDASALDRALRRLAHEVAEKNDGLDGVVLVGRPPAAYAWRSVFKTISRLRKG